MRSIIATAALTALMAAAPLAPTFAASHGGGGGGEIHAGGGGRGFGGGERFAGGGRGFVGGSHSFAGNRGFVGSDHGFRGDHWHGRRGYDGDYYFAYGDTPFWDPFWANDWGTDYDAYSEPYFAPGYSYYAPSYPTYYAPAPTYRSTYRAAPVQVTSTRLGAVMSDLGSINRQIAYDRSHRLISPSQARTLNAESATIRREAITTARRDGGTLPNGTYHTLLTRIGSLDRTLRHDTGHA